jgi:hypothetical protein
VAILAIDPGNVESGYVIVADDLSRVLEKGKVDNFELLEIIEIMQLKYPVSRVAIEMVASYGMSVGATVFETCVWIGRFTQAFLDLGYDENAIVKIYRKDEKMTLCHSMKAKDSNIRQALIDRFGIVGTKKEPGYFYGFKKDMWAAMAVAVTYHDMYLEPVR